LTEYLASSYFLDFGHDAVKDFAALVLRDVDADPIAVAEALFEAVRDGWWYDPYRLSADAAEFRASAIVQTESAWCVPKAVLLTALARGQGIPARLGFADVKNHLSSDKLRASMGTDLFAWHGYSELWLDGRWVKLSSAFNQGLCDRFGVKVLAFDPVDGALMHPFDASGQRHMEYVNERGSFTDLPLVDIVQTFAKVYPGWGDIMANVDGMKPAMDFRQ
tara:strand:- start:108 stop:767 length:660 start_codon:yes stop_codon:yes gene_type:complete